MKLAHYAGVAVLCLAAMGPVLGEPGHSEKLGKEDWSGIRLLAAEGDYLYSLQGDDCWRTDTRSAKSEKVAGKGWKQTTALAVTTVGDDVFIVSLQGADCFVTHVKSGNDAKLEAGDWSTTRCWDIDGTKLYSVSGKSCWETDLSVDPPVSKKIRADEDWSKVRFIQILGDKLYTVDDALWCTAITGDEKSHKVGDGDWSKVKLFQVANGGIYSIQGKSIWYTNPETGESKKFNNEDWSDVKFFVAGDKNYLYSVAGKDLWRTETK